MPSALITGANRGLGLGPVVYFEFPHAEGRPEWKAAGGVLFGLSDATSDFTYKFDLEVEF